MNGFGRAECLPPVHGGQGFSGRSDPAWRQGDNLCAETLFCSLLSARIALIIPVAAEATALTGLPRLLPALHAFSLGVCSRRAASWLNDQGIPCRFPLGRSAAHPRETGSTVPPQVSFAS